MTTENVMCDLDSWFADTLGNAGNGGGNRAVIGLGTSSWAYVSRTGLRFGQPTGFGSITSTSQITGLHLFVRASSAVTGIGSAVAFYAERCTVVFTENSEARQTWVSTVGGANSHWPGPTVNVTNRGSYSGSPASGDWLDIDITALGQDWWTNQATWGSLHLKLSAQDETLTNKRCTVYTREAAGSEPYVVLTYSTNSPPSAPSVSMSPLNTIIGTGTQTMSFDMNDPDGDQCDQCYVQVSTDNTFASVTHWDSGWVAPTTATGGRVTKTYGGTALTRGVQYYWRAKVKDPAGAASGYSAAQAFKLNSLPTATSRVPG